MLKTGKARIIGLIFIFSIFTANLFAQSQEAEKNAAVLENGLGILRKYFSGEQNWLTTRPSLSENVDGLIHFVEDKPIDSILMQLNNYLQDSSFTFVYRLPENVSDSLSVPGYYPQKRLEKDMEKMGIELQKKYQDNEISIPVDLFENIEKKAGVIPPGKGMQLFNQSIYSLPDSLIIPEVIPDSLLENAASYQRLLKLDSFRADYIEQKRLAYNDSILKAYRDSVVFQYRRHRFEQEYNMQKKRLADSVKLNNYEALKTYNDAVVNAVNDSIFTVLKVLSEYADFIDTSKIEIRNLVDDSYEFKLSSRDNYINRIWLKNEQNDSLSVLVKSLDKNTIQMLIDDGVTISRFRPKETKKIDFLSMTNRFNNFNRIGKKYALETPWQLGANTNVGFTQTHLSNWKKGGQSALSLLIVLKGTANYSRADGKVKWENSVEIRNGYIKPGGEDSELQKNDDKFELISRYGISAFKKWYYSAELDFETQFFRGYKYPTDDYPDPISSFLAPAKTFIKLGFDYKPNKDFSLLLSPITVKNVFVKDTVLIDQTNFNIDEGRKAFWEPGLNADLTFKKDFLSNITYTTKYKMFINYKNPFSKFDINWENQVNVKLTNYINMQMLFHLIYDDDVLFPVYDKNGEPTGEEKPRLQLKQLVTVGFTYSINYKVQRTKRLR